MRRIDAATGWKLRIIGSGEQEQGQVDADVPGSVYGTLLKNGTIPDPYYRDNELKVLPIMENDFEYTCTLAVTEENLAADALMLVFEGIDTVADIFLNDSLLASVKNMHRRYEFAVKDLVHAGGNSLRVLIKSPIKYIKEENAKVYCGGSWDAMEGFPHIRKAHCMFGWDWGPRIPDAGIWRPVYLLEINKAGFADARFSSEIDTTNGTADVRLEFAAECFAPGSYSVEFSIKDPEGNEAGRSISQRFDSKGKNCPADSLSKMPAVHIENARFWYPNGYGGQPLYTVCATLRDEEGNVTDTFEKRIGLRKVTVNTEKDEWGNCFAHEVNGIKIFAMGADYIPDDNIFSRITPERTRQLLEDAKAANHNVIRVWGGGYYPDDFFYDICDELGLLVWQDFMFACASYELDDEFDREIRAEVRDNVRRLRHHASLGLWCGNNEMETQTLDGCWRPSVKQKADYIKIFEYIIPEVVKTEDPYTFYWPSSPSSGGSFDNPWDENRGDTHYWDVWHGNKPFTEYRKFRFRYLSEFGFQAFPDLSTIYSFTEPGDRNVFSRVMEMHQRNLAANGKIMNYLSATYLYPDSFERFVYFSQLLQAEAIRYGVEHFRRHRGRCMGTVVWQLNDIWPVSSWSSIDSHGNWKALHYAEKRMFAPVLVSCEEHGEIDNRPFCIMEPGKNSFVPSVRFNVSNETYETVKGTVIWEIKNAAGETVEGENRSGKKDIEVAPLSAVFTDEITFEGLDPLSEYISFAFISENCIIGNGTALFAAPKHFRFEDPALEARLEGKRIRVTSRAFAKNVEIRRKSSDPSAHRLVLSDNFFDMETGTRYIDIIEGTVGEEDILIQSVFG